MIGGQVIDVKETGHEVSEDMLDTIYKLKTSALIESSMMIGAVLGGAEDAPEIASLDFSSTIRFASDMPQSVT